MSMDPARLARWDQAQASCRNMVDATKKYFNYVVGEFDDRREAEIACSKKLLRDFEEVAGEPDKLPFLIANCAGMITMLVSELERTK